MPHSDHIDRWQRESEGLTPDPATPAEYLLRMRGMLDRAELRLETTMRDRVRELYDYDHDCTEDESATLKRLLDDATPEERDAIAFRWPLEWAEWNEEVDSGHRG